MSERKFGIISRRRAIQDTLATLAIAAIYAPGNESDLILPAYPIVRPPKLGLTFSQLQCEPGYLNTDYQNAFREVCNIPGLQLVRLCTYMDEIKNPKEGYRKIDWLMDYAASKDLDVILTVGMKSPRWPEFHVPLKMAERLQIFTKHNLVIGGDQQTQDEVCEYTAEVVEHFKGYSNLLWWQSENEANGSFMRGHVLDDSLIKAEVQTVMKHKTDNQKILMAGPFGTYTYAQSVHKNISFGAKAVGVNLYPEKPDQDGKMIEMNNGQYGLLKLTAGAIHLFDREAWITEAMAEPWEPGGGASYGKPFYQSASPEKTKILCSRAARAGFDTQLLWGGEFWYKQQESGYPEWMDEMRKYFAESKQLDVF